LIGFGISCVVAILLVALLLAITITHGITERRKQEQADGIGVTEDTTEVEIND